MAGGDGANGAGRILVRRGGRAADKKSLEEFTKFSGKGCANIHLLLETSV